MGKQRSHRNRTGDIPGSQSVNPLGKSPDDKYNGEVLSEGAQAAKKNNTKR